MSDETTTPRTCVGCGITEYVPKPGAETNWFDFGNGARSAWLDAQSRCRECTTLRDTFASTMGLDTTDFAHDYVAKCLGLPPQPKNGSEAERFSWHIMVEATTRFHYADAMLKARKA